MAALDRDRGRERPAITQGEGRGRDASSAGTGFGTYSAAPETSPPGAPHAAPRRPSVGCWMASMASGA